jgi:hypothetical protein
MVLAIGGCAEKLWGGHMHIHDRGEADLAIFRSEDAQFRSLIESKVLEGKELESDARDGYVVRPRGSVRCNPQRELRLEGVPSPRKIRSDEPRDAQIWIVEQSPVEDERPSYRDRLPLLALY